MTPTGRAALRGLRDGAPFVLVVGPFGLLFGVVATEAGLDVAQVMGFSVLVIAGAAQLTALQLMVDEAPTLVVLLSALAVNLRMAMYSASMVPLLGAAPAWRRAVAAYVLTDQSYACTVAEAERNPGRPWPERLAYFSAAAWPVAMLWYGFTWAGAALGTAIPETWALDFAVPITFLAIIAPALRTLAHLAAAATAVALSLGLAGLPWNLGVIVAGAAAMMVGAEMERRRDP
jgi:predicted branched-subunit amino acid permease